MKICFSDEPETDDFIKEIALMLIKNEVDILNEPCNKITRNSIHFGTISIRALNRLMSELGISWTLLGQLLNQYVPIHPEIADYLKGICEEDTDEVDELLSQDFVKMDTLAKQKWLRNLGKEMDILCAVDGITVKHGGPVLDWKRYLNNLRYGQADEKPNVYDDDPNRFLKQLHAQAVRDIYYCLEGNEWNSLKVYRVMQKLALEECGIELPDSKPRCPMVDEGVLCQLKEKYLCKVGKERFQMLVKMLKLETDRKRPAAETDEKNRKRKRDEEEDECGNTCTESSQQDDEEPTRKDV